MYRYDEIDQRLVDERVRQFRDQTRRFLAGELLRGRVPRAAAAQRPLHPAPRADAARRDSLRPAVHRRSCASSRTSRAPTTAATATSPRARTCSSTGRSSRTCPRSSPSSRRCRCTPSRPAATACATSPPTISPASRPTRSSTRSCGARSSGSGRRSTPSSRTCRASSRSRSTAPATDRAATWVHDIGLHAVRDAAGEIGFRVIVGGGLGRTPIIGHVVREFLPWRHLLTYLDAILRVYNRYGRRDNIHKARIKILVKERGPEAFRAEVEAEWAHLKDGPATLVPEEVARVAARFTRPAYETLPGPRTSRSRRARATTRRSSPGRSATCTRTRSPGYAAVTALAQEDRRAAGRRRPPTRWTRSPTSPTATASASCASRTSRT